ncbi:MAG: PH domain-containing protein [Planctomycetota bacterium]
MSELSDSEPGDSSAELPGRGARVLCGGHLHPGMLFLRFLDGLRQSVVPVIVALLIDQPTLIVVALVFFVLGMGLATLRFATFSYQLTAEELVTREGVFRRQERRIPVDRIQDLQFESSPLRRLLSLVVVTVETASGQGSEATLDSITRRDALRLREALHRLRPETRLAEQGRGGRPLYRASAGELILLGLSDNRLGAILLFGLGLLEFGDQLGLGTELLLTFGGVARGLAGLDSILAVGLIVGLGFLLVLAGWTLSVAGAVALYHDFELEDRNDVLSRRFGLLTRRARSLPRKKIQRLLLEAPPLRRLFGLQSMRADSAGSSEQEDSAPGRDVLVPLSSRENIERLVPWLLQGASLLGRRFGRVSPKVILRTGMRGLILALVLAAAFWVEIGSGVVVFGILPLLGLAAGLLILKNAGYARDRSYVYFRWGILGRTHAILPLKKVQCASLRAGPFERVAGLARVTVYVAGGNPTTLPNLPRGEAEVLVRWIGSAASERPFDG